MKFLLIDRLIFLQEHRPFQVTSIITLLVSIGITPQGTICFVSEAWGGRTSDKFLTENCGFLDNLIPGDLVLADRGFTVHESVQFRQAKLNIPAFTKGEDQLDPADVEQTRKIATVGIHVERIIGLLRQKYTILQQTLPTDYLICRKKWLGYCTLIVFCQKQIPLWLKSKKNYPCLFHNMLANLSNNISCNLFFIYSILMGAPDTWNKHPFYHYKPLTCGSQSPAS